MIERLRVREVKRRLARGQDEQQAAVVVIGGEDVCLRRLGAVTFRVHGHGLVQNADAPLESGADVVIPVLELEPEDLVDGPPDHLEIAEAGELPSAPPGADQAALLVAEEERRVGRRVVVVEELEKEPETALLAPASAALKACRPLGGDAAISAAGADEVRHGAEVSGAPLDGGASEG